MKKHQAKAHELDYRCTVQFVAEFWAYSDKREILCPRCLSPMDIGGYLSGRGEIESTVSCSCFPAHETFRVVRSDGSGAFLLRDEVFGMDIRDALIDSGLLSFDSGLLP